MTCHLVWNLRKLFSTSYWLPLLRRIAWVFQTVCACLWNIIRACYSSTAASLAFIRTFFFLLFCLKNNMISLLNNRLFWLIFRFRSIVYRRLSPCKIFFTICFTGGPKYLNASFMFSMRIKLSNFNEEGIFKLLLVLLFLLL